MENFIFQNPVKILFGKGMAAKAAALIPAKAKILLVYGGGSVKKNGSYDQTVAAIGKRKFVEFGGIEPNPEYATCMKAVKLARDKKLDFIIALGGGSVIDACKFIAAAAVYKGKDPWDILEKGLPVKDALPFGTVLTLPATGSEMNMNSVVSRREIGKKLAFAAEKVYPQFSVLDPTFTYTLPRRQTRNGVIDAFVHVMEQYLTRPANAEIQDRFAESIAQTLVKEGPVALKKPEDYDCRANIMLAATMALNHLIAVGVPQDWSSHLIGHELTALYGLDHAETLAIALPKVMEYKKAQKLDKIVQLGRRVFGIEEKGKIKAANATIEAVKKFFVKMGAGVELKSYKLPADAPEAVGKNIARTYKAIGENGDITPADVVKILKI
ncbi:MAG: NADH-dependent alcohol dehydrogenase [Verrucomicrobia bacterium CAG:312_58_20]|nr:MAG: NADH-dependent alcohol dehydrogenase [Verrucomicrobia bacterium CAG:312_58_20]